jgi:glycosyltransferase involved in cell wall biosynthesis
LFKHATGKWIFQIDADEYPSDSLLSMLTYITTENLNTDVILVPRVNIVNGITVEHIEKWRWAITTLNHPKFTSTVDIDSIDSDYLELLRKYNCVIWEDANRITFRKPVINFPDYQWRLYQNKESIRWINPVHEILSGYKTYSMLPQDVSWALVHIKDIQRQEKQNEYYDKISSKK